jgi:MIP family channel proteins
MHSYGKSALAELIGTFTLVFVGAMAGALAGPDQGGIVAVALAHGVALTIIVYAWGPISGAHVNPAVTFGVLVGGKMPLSRAIVYWIAQCVGAIAAALLLFWLIGTQGDLGATVGTLTQQVGTVPDAATKVVVLEAVLTFFLVIAVYGSAISGRNGSAFGLAIGLVLTADILAGGMLTGASMNPARSLGPALVMRLVHRQSMRYVWMYFVGPLAGGGIAGLVYSRLYLDKK